MTRNGKPMTADEFWSHLSQREKDKMFKIMLNNLEIEKRQAATKAPLLTWQNRTVS